MDYMLTPPPLTPTRPARFMLDEPSAIDETLHTQQKAIQDDVENLAKKQKVRCAAPGRSRTCLYCGAAPTEIWR